MTIREQDIKLLASRVMADVPDGGRGPTGTAIAYGASNAVFSDATETDYAGGNVSIRQLHMGVLTPDVNTLLGPSIILASPPTHPSVSITLAKCGLFARRSEIAAAIADYLIKGPQWHAVLLEDHVVGMRSLQLFHRPGTPAPDINRTLVLTWREGMLDERVQFVRVVATSTETRTFTTTTGGGFLDYQAQVSKVDLSDALRFAFPGSPPSRDFSVTAGRTVVRDTTVADAAQYYGAAVLSAPASLGDTQLRADTIYSQIVPSSRTEVTALDQYPAATRTIVLAEAPRRIEVPVAAHTQRIKIGQSNRGFAFVALLRPLPEPGGITISYRALGNWYTLSDDGAGVLTGYGSGRVIYTSGSMDMTLQAMPDDGSAIIIQWVERSGYNSRASQGASVRAPQYAFVVEREGGSQFDMIVPGTLHIPYYSAGVLRTVTDSGNGSLQGDGSGIVDYPSRSVLLRPAYMPDAGAQLRIECDLDALVTEMPAVPAPDAGGFITLSLAQQPAAGTLQVSWATARQVSRTSGAQLTTASAVKTTDIAYSMRAVPEYYEPAATAGMGVIYAGFQGRYAS